VMSLPAPPPPATLRTALTSISAAATGRRLIFFVDYDGTLSPIVNDPDAALLPSRTRAALNALAARYTTAVVSGRSLKKLRALVPVPGIVFAGSHGFEISGPPGTVPARTVGGEWRPALAAAAADLAAEVLSAFPGSAVEDNNLSITLHYRNAALAPPVEEVSYVRGGVPPLRSLPALEAAVDDIAKRHGLRRTHGKCVYELRPMVAWDKGTAVLYLLDSLGLANQGVLPVYIGDDVTDEDAFRALAKCGGIGVRVAPSDDHTATHAPFRMEDTTEVCELLEHFAFAPSGVPASVKWGGDLAVRT
jgi:trehalose-phosphatase